MSSIRAIIPAAGIGKRMRPLTHTRPKVLLPLAGRPIIGHLVADLLEVGVKDITVVIGYHGEKVEQYCRSAFPQANFRFRWQEKRLGLGHAVGEAIDEGDERLLIVLGDTLFRGDLGAFSGDEAALGLVQVEDPRRFGVAVVEEGRITFLQEKPDEPRSDLALAGVYYLPDARKLKRAIDELVENDIKTRGEYQITDALQRMIEAGDPFRPVELEAWYDAGMPSTLIETNRILLDLRPELTNVPDNLRKNNTIIEPVTVAEDAEISESVIGPHVHVGSGCSIRRSVIRDSIVDENCTLEGMHLSGSALGQEVSLRRGPESLMAGDHAGLEDPE